MHACRCTRVFLFLLPHQLREWTGGSAHHRGSEAGQFIVEYVVSDLEFQTVYNTSSFSLASMAATTTYLWFRSYAVADKYKSAVVISGLVTFIAAYHHMRIFNLGVKAMNTLQLRASKRGLHQHYRANVDGRSFQRCLPVHGLALDRATALA